MEARKTLGEVEKQVILERLYVEDGNMVHTAQSLDIGLRTLQRKLRSYGYKSQGTGKVAQRAAVAFAKGGIVC